MSHIVTPDYWLNPREVAELYAGGQELSALYLIELKGVDSAAYAVATNPEYRREFDPPPFSVPVVVNTQPAPKVHDSFYERLAKSATEVLKSYKTALDGFRDRMSTYETRQRTHGARLLQVEDHLVRTGDMRLKPGPSGKDGLRGPPGPEGPPGPPPNTRWTDGGKVLEVQQPDGEWSASASLQGPRGRTGPGGGGGAATSAGSTNSWIPGGW